MTAIDLFSGCGGLSEGLKQAGFDVLAALELDPFAVEAYALNHSGVRVWTDDIRTVDPWRVRRVLGLDKGELDLLAGCPPCQGFSRLRTKNGKWEIDEPRNDLVFAFRSYVAEFCPKVIMFENVPGLKADVRFATLKCELSDLGYELVDQILDAAHYGVPQKRKRLILIGSRLGPVTLCSPSPIRVTVRHAIGDLPAQGTSGDALHDIAEKRSPKIRSLIRSIPRDGGSRASLPKQLECHVTCSGFKDVYGRMAWDRQAPTITGGCFNPSKGRFLHPQEDRAISLREAALLQSFPPHYRFPLRRGKTSVALLIGNALPPELIRRQAAHVADILHDHELSTSG